MAARTLLAVLLFAATSRGDEPRGAPAEEPSVAPGDEFLRHVPKRFAKL